MLDEVYNARVLAFAANIPRLGRLTAPHGSSTAHSRLCGSTMTVDIRMDGGAVVDFGHEVRACVLGQAAAAIMAHHVVGTTAAELVALRDRMLAMLTANGPPPDGAFGDLACLEPVRAHRSRHASTMLTFDAVVAALHQASSHRQFKIASLDLPQSEDVLRFGETPTWSDDQDRGARAC